MKVETAMVVFMIMLTVSASNSIENHAPHSMPVRSIDESVEQKHEEPKDKEEPMGEPIASYVVFDENQSDEEEDDRGSYHAEDEPSSFHNNLRTFSHQSPLVNDSNVIRSQIAHTYSPFIYNQQLPNHSQNSNIPVSFVHQPVHGEEQHVRLHTVQPDDPSSHEIHESHQVPDPHCQQPGSGALKPDHFVQHPHPDEQSDHPGNLHELHVQLVHQQRYHSAESGHSTPQNGHFSPSIHDTGILTRQPYQISRQPVRVSQQQFQISQQPLQFAQHPAQIVQPPVQVVQPPVQVAQPHVQVAHPHVQVAQPHVQVAQPHVQVVQPHVQVAQHPAQVAQHPAQVAQHPAQVAQHPAQVAQHPAPVAQHPVQVSQQPVYYSSEPYHHIQQPLMFRDNVVNSPIQSYGSDVIQDQNVRQNLARVFHPSAMLKEPPNPSYRVFGDVNRDRMMPPNIPPQIPVTEKAQVLIYKIPQSNNLFDGGTIVQSQCMQRNPLEEIAEERRKLDEWKAALGKREKSIQRKEAILSKMYESAVTSNCTTALIDDWCSEDDIGVESELGPWRSTELPATRQTIKLENDIPPIDPKKIHRTYSRKRKKPPPLNKIQSNFCSVSPESIDLPSSIPRTVCNGDTSVTIVPIKKDDTCFEPFPTARRIVDSEHSWPSIAQSKEIPRTSSFSPIQVDTKDFTNTENKIKFGWHKPDVKSRTKELIGNTNISYQVHSEHINASPINASTPNHLKSMFQRNESSTSDGFPFAHYIQNIAPRSNGMNVNPLPIENYSQSPKSVAFSPIRNSAFGENRNTSYESSRILLLKTPPKVIKVIKSPIFNDGTVFQFISRSEANVQTSVASIQSSTLFDNNISQNCIKTPESENINAFSNDMKQEEISNFELVKGSLDQNLIFPNSNQFGMIDSEAHSINISDSPSTPAAHFEPPITDQQTILDDGSEQVYRELSNNIASFKINSVKDQATSLDCNGDVGLPCDEFEHIPDNLEHMVVDSSEYIPTELDSTALEVSDATKLATPHDSKLESSLSDDQHMSDYDPMEDTPCRKKRKITKTRKKTPKRKNKGRVGSKNVSLLKLGDYSGMDTVCGKCSDDVIYHGEDFLVHIVTEHNGVARPKGKSQEFTNTEQRVAFTAALGFRKFLLCLECGVKFRSVNGFEGHIRFCGKDPKERIFFCDYCKGPFTFFTLKVHSRTCNKQSSNEETIQENKEILFSPSGRPSRKAKRDFNLKMKILYDDCKVDDDVAESATQDEAYEISNDEEFDEDEEFLDDYNSEEESKNEMRTSNRHRRILSKLTETFSADNISFELTNHWESMIELGNKLTCFYSGCEYVSSNLQDYKDHLLQCSFTVEGLLTCVLCPDVPQSETAILDHMFRNHPDSAKDRIISQIGRNRKHTIPLEEQFIVGSILEAFTVGSEENNLKSYRTDVSEWSTLNESVESSKSNCLICFSGSDEKQILEGSKSKCIGDDVYINVCGNITASDWCPNQRNQDKEFIAVAVSKFGNSTRNVLQIWLNNDNEMFLQYSISHSLGDINCIQWCPLRDWGEHHIGAIALSSASSPSIHVWILPEPGLMADVSPDKIYHKKPDIIFEYDGDIRNSAFKIQWHLKENNVVQIAAGTSDGLLIIWEISSERTNSLFDGETIFPKSMTRCHRGAVKGISWNSNPYFSCLSTGGMDHNHIIWMLEGEADCISNVRRDFVNDTTWTKNATTSMVTFDDCTKDGSSTTAFRECDYMGNSNISHCKTSGIAVRMASSNFQYTIAVITDTGNVQLVFCRDLHRISYDKGWKYVIHTYGTTTKKLSSPDAKEVIVFDSEPVELRVTRDTTSSALQTKTKKSSATSKDKIDQYFNSSEINQPTTLCFSSNYRSQNKLFVGYQNGVGRIINSKCPYS